MARKWLLMHGKSSKRPKKGLGEYLHPPGTLFGVGPKSKDLQTQLKLLMKSSYEVYMIKAQKEILSLIKILFF